MTPIGVTGRFQRQRHSLFAILGLRTDGRTWRLSKFTLWLSQQLGSRWSIGRLISTRRLRCIWKPDLHVRSMFLAGLSFLVD